MKAAGLAGSKAGRLHAHPTSMTPGNSRQQGGILVIDDEEGFLELLRSALESQGYTVHVASSADEAIKLYEERWRDISVVLLDYLLPEMSGDLLFQTLKSINPDVRVLLVTGCEAPVVATKMFRGGLWGHVQKPVDVSELHQKLWDVINTPSASSVPSPV